eukprot:1451515-Amphidinium_carterae.2
MVAAVNVKGANGSRDDYGVTGSGERFDLQSDLNNVSRSDMATLTTWSIVGRADYKNTILSASVNIAKYDQNNVVTVLILVRMIGRRAETCPLFSLRVSSLLHYSII